MIERIRELSRRGSGDLEMEVVVLRKLIRPSELIGYSADVPQGVSGVAVRKGCPPSQNQKTGKYELSNGLRFKRHERGGTSTTLC